MRKIRYSKEKRLIIVVNVDWFFLSHRLSIALKAKSEGFDVVIIARDTGRSKEIISHGLKFIPLPMSRSRLNLFNEIYAVIFLYKKYYLLNPFIVHHVALKTIIYGSIAAYFSGVPKIINAISGLGYVFINERKHILVKNIILHLIKLISLNGRVLFILQNLDDFNYFIYNKIINRNQTYIIKGSGVDIKNFPYTIENIDMKVIVTLPARILYDKGVYEFVESAKILKKNKQIIFQLVGPVDYDNRASIKNEVVLNWVNKGLINWLGNIRNMNDVYKKSNIIVLPSYREGLPKVLLEAMSAGRSIITTNVPGCRELVKWGNGILVDPKDPVALASAIKELAIDPEKRLEMGKKNRLIAVKYFSTEVINKQIFHLYN